MTLPIRRDKESAYSIVSGKDQRILVVLVPSPIRYIWTRYQALEKLARKGTNDGGLGLFSAIYCPLFMNQSKDCQHIMRYA